MSEVYFCERCTRTMNEDNFYTSNNLEKYPAGGKLKMCKKCITARVDNWDPETYMWILQEIDVPYVPDEWNKLLVSHGKDKSKLTGMTILGRYLSKMKLRQFKEFRWKDSEYLQQIAQHKIEQTMKKQGYDAQQINDVLTKATFDLPKEELVAYDIAPDPEEREDVPTADYFDQVNGFDDNELVADLTDEDKIYLRLKWGKAYKPAEWVELEKLFQEMVASYEVTTAGHIDTLKLACKASLKTNQLMDIGDIDGAQKMAKMYDMFMKSGKFTAQQNKTEKNETINSVSELVLMCEKDGFIPRYYTAGPQDKVDYVLQDMQDYTRQLITEEMHLGALIEKAVHSIEEDRLREQENELDDISDEEAFERDLFSEREDDGLIDQDYSDFNLFEEEEANKDEAYFLKGGN